MKLGVLVSIASISVAITVGIVNFYFQQSWYYLGITFSITFICSFTVFYYLVEKYIYTKIKLIYKQIHHLKLGKELKETLEEYRSDNPLSEVEYQVKEWATEKRKEIDSLKKQEKFRKEFLSNVSHEFKTPLFAVQGYVETLEEIITEDPESAKHFLRKAAANIERLNYLINDLDTISKLESGEIVLKKSKFDFVLLVKEVFEILEDKAKSRNIRFEFKEKYQRPTIIKADKEKIRQVLINLIENSVKYGKEDGFTAVKIFELHERYLIEVTDNGIGIDSAHLPRLFERFYRADAHRSRMAGGTGLGLAIVKHILEAHEQTISVRSSLNIGTTFAFTLQKNTF